MTVPKPETRTAYKTTPTSARRTTIYDYSAAAFLFARELGIRESVALIAAAGWMYSTAISFFILWPLGESWALFPLVGLIRLTSMDQLIVDVRKSMK